jgi:hypothetical protein
MTAKRKRRGTRTGPRVILWDRKDQARAELVVENLSNLVEQARHLVEDLMLLKANSQRRRRAAAPPQPARLTVYCANGLDDIAPITGCQCPPCRAARERGEADREPLTSR